MLDPVPPGIALDVLSGRSQRAEFFSGFADADDRSHAPRPVDDGFFESQGLGSKEFGNPETPFQTSAIVRE